jgi:hypothetical protein
VRSRVYDPEALRTDERALTIVFAGYNTTQLSNTAAKQQLSDYRAKKALSWT